MVVIIYSHGLFWRKASLRQVMLSHLAQPSLIEHLDCVQAICAGCQLWVDVPQSFPESSHAEGSSFACRLCLLCLDQTQ